VDEEGQLPQGDEEPDAAALLAGVDPALIVEHVIIATADEASLVQRLGAPGDAHTNLAGVYRRIAEYKQRNTVSLKPHMSVEAWFGAILTNEEGTPRAPDLLPVDMTTTGNATGTESIAHTSPNESSSTDVFAMRLTDIRSFLGEPRFIRPTAEEILRRREEGELEAESTRIEEIRKSEEEEKERAAVRGAEDRVRRTDERRARSVREERDAAATEVTALSMNEYLMKYVVAAVADATAQVAELRPEDPVNSLADILFTYQPKDKQPLKGGIARL
jgi:hypothetical protein